MAKKKVKTIEEGSVNCWNVLYYSFILIFAAVISVSHSIYLYTLFENDRFFSHLSDLEREMSYRTEMGLYFSYYKTIVTAPSYLDGLKKIMYDDRIEAGHTINALQRFNLYPEVYLGGFYRIFKGLTKYFGWNNEICYQINRGKLPPVNSCEGIGNLHFFYNYAVFGLAGTVLGSVFILGTILSNTFMGGIISAAAYMYNHGHATRVQWTPPLRESFGFPVFFFQLALLTLFLRNKNPGRWGLFFFGWATLHFMLFWQFAGFALYAQVSCLFVTFSLGFIDKELMRKLWITYFVALLASYLLLFGNSLILNSLFFTGLIAFKVISLLDSKINLSGLPRLLIYTILYMTITVALKAAIGISLNIQDDNHIFDILKSKFTDFATFHTMLYTCAAEFDFIPLETLVELSETYLTVLALLGLQFVVLLVFKNVLIFQREDSKDHSHVVFNAGQMVVFMVMAWLLMRLKLFAVPQMCVFISVLLNTNFLKSVLGFNYRWKSVVFVLIIAMMTYKGRANIIKQLSVKGEYSNEAQEFLFHWIEENTHKDDVFAGSMPTMANVELSTGRKVFNHPHYEDAGLRERTATIYAFYGRKNPNEIHKTWKKLGINYFIFEPFLCRGHKRSECTYLGIFDRVSKEDLGRPPNCDRFLPLVESNNGVGGFSPFTLLYNSPSYVVLRI